MRSHVAALLTAKDHHPTAHRGQGQVVNRVAPDVRGGNEGVGRQDQAPAALQGGPRFKRADLAMLAQRHAVDATLRPEGLQLDFLCRGGKRYFWTVRNDQPELVWLCELGGRTHGRGGGLIQDAALLRLVDRQQLQLVAAVLDDA
jgi:hypothetical protein